MVSTPLDIPIVRAPGERRLYAIAALVAILIVFAGFAPTYYLKGAFGTPDLSTLKHVHGLVMTAWFALFLTQALLVAKGRTATHRKLGVAGALLALLVVVVATTLAIASARSGSSPIGVPPLIFLVIPLGEMVMFAGLVTAAVVMRKRSAYHKRLMLLASIAILAPAIARLPFDFIQTGSPLVFFGLTDLVILACIGFDVAKNRRLHPAFAAGLVFVVVTQIGRLALSQTPQWMTFAKWLVA